MVKKALSKRRNIASGVVNVSATFNNTIVTIADASGDVVSWSSAGANGFKGSRKSTPYAAQVSAEAAAAKAVEAGMRTAVVKLKGPGAGRDAAARALVNLLNITAIHDVTPVPHGGCRKRKRRRV
ncbi:MAG: 30S ribosomal protein S11 [Proteobacteria bacterium]|nr:30S ribosomal protein S11 [Pseudomonadota bacterium]